MTTPPAWVTFDCYGTLVDWRSGMTRALEWIAPGNGRALLEIYHEHEPVLENGGVFLPYREVLAEGVRRAAADLGLSLASGQEDVLSRSLPSWPVFPEVVETLKVVRAAGWRIGVLSNVDDDLIRATLPQLIARVDVCITAQQVRSYKPALPHFERFKEISGVHPGDWIHVACSWVHDVESCLRLGVPVVFVNREAEMRDTSAAEAVLTDLEGLPAVLQSIRAAAEAGEGA